jgi:hypothetical protein
LDLTGILLAEGSGIKPETVHLLSRTTGLVERRGFSGLFIGQTLATQGHAVGLQSCGDRPLGEAMFTH